MQGTGGAPISRARLFIYAKSSSTSGLDAEAVNDNSWDEYTVTSANGPALGSILASSPPVTGGTWIAFDVTSYVTGEGLINFGVSTAGPTAIGLSSRESGANSPQLIVDFQTGAPDTQAPEIPTGLTANAVSTTQVDLSWNASTDNLAVAGYTIYRDGTEIATVSDTSLSYSDTTVVSATTYQYSVDAFDAAGNHSAASCSGFRHYSGYSTHRPDGLSSECNKLHPGGLELDCLHRQCSRRRVHDLPGWDSHHDCSRYEPVLQRHERLCLASPTAMRWMPLTEEATIRRPRPRLR